MTKKDKLTGVDAVQLFEDSSVLIFKCEASVNYPVTFVSSNSQEILGFKSTYFLNHEHGWANQIHPDDRKLVDKQFKKILKEGGSATNEYRFKRKDGKEIWLRDEIKIQKDEDGTPIAILGACFDITDRKKLEIEAQENIESELRKRLDYQNALSECSNLLVDGTGVDTVEKALRILLDTTDTERVYIFTSNKGKDNKITLSQIHEVCREGVTPEIDNPDLQNMPFDSLPWVFTNLSKNNIVDLPIRKLPAAEREFMADQDIKSFLLLPIFIEDEWFGFMGFDSTRYEKQWDENEIILLKTAAEIIGTYFRRKSVESSLLQQKNFTQQILDSLPSIVVLMNKKMEFLQWNETAEKLTGYPANELSQKTAYDIIAPEDHKEMEGALLTKDNNEGEELNLQHKNGKKSLYFWRGEILKLEGEPVFVIVGLNISKQKEIEEALVEEKRLADAIINSMPGVFYVIDTEGNYVRINKNFIEEFGYSQEELKNIKPEEFFEEEEQEKLSKNIEQVFETGSADVELSPITKEGEKLPYYFKAVRFERKNEYFLIGTGHNISEQKKREAELQSSLKEKQVLLQEIHHRVKNNLAVVSGLLELQVYEFEDPELQRLVRDSQRRIQTMAMIHEKLYQSESLSHISVLNYIDDLISQIERSFNIRNKDIEVETSIEDTDLNINQAIPFALTINEIISNSFEHAFIGRKKGKVEVKVHEVEGEIYTIIKDNGVGFTDTSSTTSLGMTLINALLTQIGAEWERIEDNGITYSIKFSKDKDRGSSSSINGF